MEMERYAMLEGIRIIAADDDKMSLEMLSTLLVSLGVHCTAVANGREALDALEADQDTDLLLLDIQMPVMDGFEVLSHCKANPCLSDIPVIVLSAERNEKFNALRLGADDFMAKPYDQDELELRITKLIQWRRLTQSSKRAKNEFLSIASHELRTPMNLITGLAELLDGENLGVEQRELVDQLKHATSSLTGIIRDILNYVQLDQGVVSAMVEPFSLRAMVQRALDSQKEAVRQSGVRLEFRISDDVSDALNGPSFYVYKVFDILVENAVKFSSEGEVGIVIREESLGRHSSRFICSVNDTGIGIHTELHEKIFEPFVQADSSYTRKHGGIGLGLAIAKRMLELMGGTISVTSNRGKGSSFNFSFNCNTQGATEVLQ